MDIGTGSFSPAEVSDSRLRAVEVRGSGGIGRVSRLGLAGSAVLCFVLSAGIPVDVATEAWLVLAVGAAVLVLASRPRTGMLRGLLLILCLLLTLRYFTWRLTETLVFYDPVSMTAAILLLLAELYGLAMMLLGLFVNVSPITRALDPVPLGPDDPAVDVLIPSYNEGADLLAVTVCAAMQIAYPAGRMRVHLLDDGGTDQKCDDPDPRKAAAARARRVELQALCKRFGATYRTRPRNTHAKAGNINYALPVLTGDLVLILDADHVPTADILTRTVPFYRHDPKLFLVQTPHFFMNPDTIEKNLDLFLKMPGENEMFHRAIQSGLDFWNSSIFCGSAAIIHRGRLLEVGGIATSTITEDAETALALHARGYSSAYVARPMVAGLAPETFTGMVTQRVRWGQGMIQILLLENPLGRRGLTMAQRLGYLSSTLYWAFGFPRLVFLLSPIGFLLFNLKIYAASAEAVLVFVLPHMLASYVSTSTLFQRFRWPLISHVYETLLGLLMLRPILATLRRPRAPDFKVTPKGEHLDRDFVSPLVWPFYLIFTVTLAALPIGLVRIWTDEQNRSLVVITMGWELFNLLVLLGALGALFERKQRRTVPRLKANMPACLMQGVLRVGGRVTNLSMGGTRFVATEGEEAALAVLDAGSPLQIEIIAPHQLEPSRLDVAVRTRGGGACGLAFSSEERQFGQIVSLVHGDSGRWMGFWTEESRTVGALGAFKLMVHTGIAALGSHVGFLGRQLASWAGARWRAWMNGRRPVAVRPSAAGSWAGGWLMAPAVAVVVAMAAVLLAARPGWAQPVAGAERTLQWVEPLAALNPVPGPINLRGDRGEFEIGFNLSTRVDPVTARLHLELSNSQALLAPRSQLVVRLNEVVVAQIGLKPGAPLTSAEVDLPVELLRGGGNRLNFMAAQHYTNECESPTAAELWSQIDTTRSRLSIGARVVETAPLLSDLQALMGPGFFGGRRFTLLTAPAPVPGGMPDDAVTAGGLIAQALGLRLRYEPAQLDVAEARVSGDGGTGLQVAAPADGPVREGLASGALAGGAAPDLVLFGTVAALRPFLGSAIADQVKAGFLGVYALPADRRRLVLVVSGTTEEEVLLAATAMGVANFPFVDAPQQLVERLEVQGGGSFFPRNDVRPGTVTAFSELGFRSATLRGPSSSTGIDVILPANVYLPDSAEAELSLDFAYAAGLRGDSVINVVLNGQFQQAIALSEASGAVLRGYRVRIPGRKLVAGQNHIAFEASMRAVAGAACQPINTDGLIWSLDDSSTLTLAQGVEMASQPDLKLFAATGFPYVGSSQFDLALGGRDRLTVAAGWTLLARLAQLAGRALPEAHLVVGAPGAERHAIIVGAAPKLAADAGAPVGLLQRVSYPYASDSPRSAEPPGFLRSVRGLVGALAGTAEAAPIRMASRVVGPGEAGTGAGQRSELGRNGLLMAARAPAGGDYTQTVLTASSGASLWASTQELVRPRVWSQLRQDVALWRVGGAAGATPEQVPDAVSTERVGPTYHLGRVDTLYAARYFIGQYPMAWLGVTAGSVVLLMVMLRLFLVSRRRRMHPDSAEGIP